MAHLLLYLNLITTFLSWPTRVLASKDRPLNVLFIIADDLGKTSDLDFLFLYTLTCLSLAPQKLTVNAKYAVPLARVCFFSLSLVR